MKESAVSTYYAAYAQDEKTVLADLTSTTGAACIGSFQASIVDAGVSYNNGIDTAPSRSACNVFGIIAPEGKFASVYSVLTGCVCSLRFTQDYIDDGINFSNDLTKQTNISLAQNSALMEAVNKNWTEYIRGNVGN